MEKSYKFYIQNQKNSENRIRGEDNVPLHKRLSYKLIIETELLTDYKDWANIL